MNVTNQNRSLVKSELRHYFIRMTIYQVLNILQHLHRVSTTNKLNTMHPSTHTKVVNKMHVTCSGETGNKSGRQVSH